MSFKLKKWSTHVQDVARRMGLSYTTVDQILKAYIEDLRDTLKAGISVKLDRLVTIHVTTNDSGTGYKTASAVSKPLRKELSQVLCDKNDITSISVVNTSDGDETGDVI